MSRDSPFAVLEIQIVPIKFNVRDEESIKTCMTKSNVVINLIGMSSTMLVHPLAPSHLLF
jgi:hypothetical protein